MVPNILIFRCYDQNSKGEVKETSNRHDLVDQFDVEVRVEKDVLELQVAVHISVSVKLIEDTDHRF